MASNLPENLEELTSGCRSFVAKYLHAPLTCLHNHCHGNVDTFVGKHTAWLHTKFTSEK